MEGGSSSSSSSSSSAKLQYMDRRIRVLLSMGQYHHPLVKLDERALDMAQQAHGTGMQLCQHPDWEDSPEDVRLLASGWFERLQRRAMPHRCQ